MTHRHHALVLAALSAGLVFRLVFVASDVRGLVDRGPLYDDSFYAFGVARHIAAGHGSTFDGEHLTNGYQPLWVGTLVPLYWLAGGDGAIYLALVLSSVLNVLTGWLLYRLLRRELSFAAAFLGLILWGFAPAVVRQAVNGLETALAMFLVALSLDYYVVRFRRHPAVPQAMTLGALLGLAVLARVDAILFAVALIWDGLRRGDSRRLRAWAVVVGVTTGMVLPWCVASRVVVGRATPESGEATRFLSSAYAAHDFPVTGQDPSGGGVHMPLWAHNLGQSVLLLGTCPSLHVFTRALERSLEGVSASGRTRTVAVLLLLAVAAIVTWRLLGARARALHDDLGFMFLYCALLIAAYSTIVFGHIFFSRYYYPMFYFSIAVAGYAADAVLARLPPARGRRVALAVAGLYLLFLPYMSWNRLRNGDYRFVHVVRWIESQTPPDARVGIFNSGAIGYFSDRRVLNLDGKVNPEALAALQRGRMRAYVADARIDYVVDHGWILDRFLHPDADADGDGLRFTPVAEEDALGVPGWRAYRVGPLQASAASPIMPRSHP